MEKYVIGLLILLSAVLMSEELIRADFETQDLNYSVEKGGIETAEDYFIRSYNSDPQANHIDLSGVQGSYYFIGKDIHSVSGLDTAAVLNIDPVNISGLNNVTVSFTLAANAENEYESVYSSFGSDYVSAQYRLDSGEWNEFALFTGGSADDESRLKEDTNSDGIGDGLALGSEFSNYSYILDVSGTVLEIRLKIYTGSGQEYVAIDNILISGGLLAPQNLITHSATDSKVELAWDPVAGADAYNIYRSTDPNSNFSLLDTSSTSAYTDSSVTTGNKYFYHIRAYTGQK